MPLLGAGIAVILSWFARLIVIKALLALAIGITTFSAYLVVMDNLEAAVITQYAGLPAELLAYLTISGISNAVGILLTALSIRATITFAPKLGVLWSAVNAN